MAQQPKPIPPRGRHCNIFVNIKNKKRYKVINDNVICYTDGDTDGRRMVLYKRVNSFTLFKRDYYNFHEKFRPLGEIT